MNKFENDIIDKAVKQAARLFHDGNLPSCQLLVNQILKMDSENDEALQVAGLLKLRTGDANAAITMLEKARAINPSNPDHHNNLALGYSKAGRYRESIGCLYTALKMAPGRQVFLLNLAVQLRNKASCDTIANTEGEQLLNDAEDVLQRVIKMNPESASAYANLGSLCAERHDMKRAAEMLEKSLEIDPSLNGVHVDLSYVYFLSGEFKKGWTHYEHRMSHYPQASRWEKVFPSSKRWDGKTSLEGKSVCVFCEQGCGDAIHFARYLPLLKCGKLYICCHDPLKELLSQFGECFGMGQTKPAYDISIPIMSLPFLLNDPEAKVPYIDVPWKADMSAYDGTLKVGLCWAGNPQHPGDRFRSISLHNLMPLTMPGVSLFSLQKDYRPRKYHDSDKVFDLCKDGPKVVDLSPLLTTFADTSRFIAAMDLVISVDTVVLHLAGAIGKETWALIPYNPDWRWGLNDNKTDLYPSVELFRQTKKNDWQPVIDMIANRLNTRRSKLPTVPSLSTG